MPFKRILSAVDFAPDSVEGFRIAVEMSSVPSASLHTVAAKRVQLKFDGTVAGKPIVMTCSRQSR